MVLLILTLINRQRFHLDPRSLQNTNRKSYIASPTEPSAFAMMTGSARNRIWHLLTSALVNSDAAITRLLTALGSC